MLINILPVVAEGKTALARLAEFGFLIDDTQDARNEPPVPGTVASPSAKSWKVIELNGVTMNYRDNESSTDFVLGPINMTIHAGELVYVIGGNGSGRARWARSSAASMRRPAAPFRSTEKSSTTMPGNATETCFPPSSPISICSIASSGRIGAMTASSLPGDTSTP